MSTPSIRETKEWIGGLVMLAICSVVALVLINSIPIVSELPEGTNSATEYVVAAVVARFGVPVVFLLFLAALCTMLGHNRGDGRPRLDFYSKVCSFGAATFSMWAGGAALIVGSGVG